MSRKIGDFLLLWKTGRLWTSRWLALFAIGAMLGGTVMLLRLSLNKLQYVSEARAMERTDLGERKSAQVTMKESAAGSTRKEVGPRPSSKANEQDKISRRGSIDETKPKVPPDAADASDRLEVRVYLTKDKRIERVPLETYVRGVIAAEMPIEFELEALKAQAIAARTYIIRRLRQGADAGMPVAGADVTDTIDHQVYLSKTALADKWPEDDRKSHMSKLDEAVAQTKGRIITYEGEPIEAAFFSTSNGYTENSEDYWQQEIPYLRSVASPWDVELSPKYKETVKLSLNDFYRRLGVKKKGGAKPSIRITEKTEGGRIAEMVIAGTAFTGREAREKLGLASSQFTWSVKGDSITITTYGYGHGVGMSQWGANGMAHEGKTADEIIRYYYTGAKVEQASKIAIASNS
ncbi:stage II sporulation protein D [Paenibacillus harenae]|uniref:stage II sporulation protein D n=1 Tax=Paenibacillus harenae TaxID=306543 RepID=UPI0006865D39|nr:stage II sporulation protein D [Paenibacillus harenae]